MKNNNDSNISPWKKTYTFDETMELLNISRSTLYRLQKRGLIRPSRAVRRLIFPATEIQRFLEDSSKQVPL